LKYFDLIISLSRKMKLNNFIIFRAFLGFFLILLLFATGCGSLKSENEQLKEEIVDVNVENEKLKKELNELKSENSKMHVRVAQLHLEIAALHNEIQNMQRDLESLKTQMREEEKKNKK